jgi:hypothetical protein
MFIVLAGRDATMPSKPPMARPWKGCLRSTRSGGLREWPLIDRVKGRFGWSDHDVADALGVGPSVVCPYRRTGVPKHQITRLRELTRTSPNDVDPPQRLVPKRGASGLAPSSRRGVTRW